MTSIVLGAPNAQELGAFYRRLLGWEVRSDEPGARLADYQPQDDVRVYLDPAGHPFCLWIPT